MSQAPQTKNSKKLMTVNLNFILMRLRMLKTHNLNLSFKNPTFIDLTFPTSKFFKFQVSCKVLLKRHSPDRGDSPQRNEMERGL